MEKYTYLILNTQYDEPLSIYIRFPKKLTLTECDIFKRILKTIKSEYGDDIDCTTWDIVYDALQRFEHDYHICGVIVDGHHGMITF